MKHRKKKKYDVKLCIALLLFFAISICFWIEAIQIFATLNHRDDSFLTYTGQYTFFEESCARNTTYVFLLDNNHTLEVHPEVIANHEFEKENTLTFRYSKNKTIFAKGRYTCVSIQSTDNEVVYLEENCSIEEMQSRAVLFLVLGILTTFLLSIIILPQYVLSFATYISKKRKKSKKKNAEDASGRCSE
ncbi:MAG: hypothetical protein E7624_07860 [Ruminococcaceae bacterium]|nr:hypothetical protein [Oscillospiraceae bacterium]